MSYFIANQITISKDRKTFKVKGGDNNVVPRSNYWSDWEDINVLLNLVRGGMLQLNRGTELLCLVDNVVGDMGDYPSDLHGYYSAHAESKYGTLEYKEQIILDQYNREFLMTLDKELNSYSLKKEYAVLLGGEYIYYKAGRGCYTTDNVDSALLFSKHKAIKLNQKYKAIGEKGIVKITK